MNKRGDDYYDEEAKVYSQKRYPEVTTNYIQFLFTHRRNLVLSMLGVVKQETVPPRSLLEIGCADGVLLRAVEEKYPGMFAEMLGTDISAPMIETAQVLTHSSHIRYAMRDEIPPRGEYTCEMEIGVGAVSSDMENEFARAAAQLVPGGLFLCVVAGRDSLATRWGMTAAAREKLFPYPVYETEMRKSFTIVRAKSYGLHVPLLWRVPFVGRVLQPVAELFGRCFPALCHERLYLLKKL